MGHPAWLATPVPLPSRDKACKFRNRAAPITALPPVPEGALPLPPRQNGSPYAAPTANRSAPAVPRAAAVARGRQGGAARAIEFLAASSASSAHRLGVA